MTTIRVAACAAALLAVALGATGCSESGETDTPTTSTVAQPWDPCTISDEALRRATLDPATEGPGLTADPPDQKSCGWENNDIDVIVTSFASATPDQFHESLDNIDFQNVIVGGRQSVTFRQASDEPGRFCHLAIPFQDGGLALMQVARSAFAIDRNRSMCDWAVQVGEGLVAELPR
ncbi:DUF3558 domain-containing protein [Rhodococcus sp. HNM0569]|uniref:DUF3558 domain-containing protein n=1 Tax=Rhodococcus sp. HNM0569 TaxID=2716340 RepID=UPI00146F5229|nr:DUF3558 domain-containing protein [Rhodococcus sp. HNM0569]NLU82097.1 DUF3558 domain-containing protein [Rhodococcus sp. HNM0569]